MPGDHHGTGSLRGDTCGCGGVHVCRKIVVTGGPGAGKTAFLEMVRRSLCPHVRVMPEAAGLVFGGGFPREDDPACKRSEQRAIYYVQRELEVVGTMHNPAVILCDRGTVDGVAYWPGPMEEFWASVGTTLDNELARYDAVIHLRTPGTEQGYNRRNPLRIESADMAAEIDERILQAWATHPRRFVVESSDNFFDKVSTALTFLLGEVPDCCARNVLPFIRDDVERR